MTTVIPPGYAQAAYQFSLSGDPEVMVSTCGVDLNATDPATIATGIRTQFAAAFPTGVLRSGWTFQGVVLRVGQDGGPPAIFESLLPHIGTEVSPVLPNNCSWLIRKTSGLGGRQGRGRMFFPPFNLDDDLVNALGIIDPTFRADMQGRVDDLWEGQDWVILHDDSDPTPPLPTPVTSFVVDLRIATQRRRLRR